MLKLMCKAVFLFTIPVFFSNGIDSHSCETHVCLTWTVGEHVLNLKCRVNNLHFGVKIKDPSDKIVGECVPSEDKSNCDKYSSNVVIAQNIFTNITTCAIHGTTDNSLNGKWKCVHGTNKGVADVEVTVLRTKVADGNCRALFWSGICYLGAITLWLLLQSVCPMQVNIVKGVLTKLSDLKCCKLDVCKSERSISVSKGVVCLVLTGLVAIIIWVILDSTNLNCKNQYYVLCSLALLFGIVFAVLFLNGEGFASSELVIWYKAPLIGSYTANDVLVKTKARSKVECSAQCSKYPGCSSFEYVILTKTCSILVVSEQSFPLVNNSDICYYLPTNPATNPCYAVFCGVGTCSNGMCSCPSDYYGVSCENYDPCYSVNCGVGTCSGGTCSCPSGYSGDSCQTYDPCHNINCGVGTCSGGTCSCPGGYSGSICQTYDPCYSVSCGVGTCSGGTCSCPGGYSGGSCQTYDPCYNINCGVGTCSGGTCNCPGGYSGSICQTYDPCYNVNCGVGTCSGGTCSCPDGYSGSNCQNSCPTGYDWLSSSNTCVKFYGGDYRSWANLKTACQADGADLPLLNTDTLFNDFRIYMDQKSSDRVAVDGTLSGNQGIWSNGDVLSSNRFCSGNPDLNYQSNVCLYFEDTAAGYCGATNNRIDDSYCDTSALRICMKKL